MRAYREDRLAASRNHHTQNKVRRNKLPRLEPLEKRELLAADVRTFDGSDNNLDNPDWGSTDVALLRLAAADYADGIAAPSGENRPSAREISNALADQPVENILNDRHLSAMIYAWGQFLDHDIDLTDPGVPYEAFPIEVPAGDPYFDPDGSGDETIFLFRSSYDPATGQTDARQQMNRITAFIDGSQIYGSDEARAAALRTFEGGKLRTSAGDLLPYNTEGLPNDNATGLPPETLFLAGDVRANENIELTSLHTLFVREHNRLADRLAGDHPDWTDEQIFQKARQLVIGELQAITYNEFLPALLGRDALSRYRGYDPSVNPGIANEFSTAAFRLGHSMLGNDVEFLDNFAEEVFDEVPLREAFFNPDLVAETNIGPILKYLASDPAQEIDNHVTDEVRNFLFGEPGQGGFDLASLNIQRGRDHGLADYNSARVAYGLSPIDSFDDITDDAALQAVLEEVYGDVNDIDMWVGGLAEDHVRGASVGPLFRAVLVDQFERLRAGDRFWYQRDLSRSELRMVERTTLVDVIARNTEISNLQDNAFEFFNTIEGQVFADADRDGRHDRGERGAGGITVELLDEDGAVVATAVTASDGTYAFEDLELGVYTVRVSLPRGTRATTRGAREIDLTRAEEFASVDFGIDVDSGGGRNGGGRRGGGRTLNRQSEPLALLDPLA